MKIDIPRDRKDEFEPQVVKKYQNTVTRDIEEKSVFCQAFFPEKSVKIPCFHQGIFPAFGGH